MIYFKKFIISGFLIFVGVFLLLLVIFINSWTWTTFWINCLLFLSVVLVSLLIYSGLSYIDIIKDNLIIINNRKELQKFFKKRNIDESKFSDLSFSIRLENRSNGENLGNIKIINSEELTLAQINYIFEKFREVEDKGVFITGPISVDWTNPEEDFIYWVNPDYDKTNQKFILDRKDGIKYFGNPNGLKTIDLSDYPIIIKEGTYVKPRLKFDIKNVLRSIETLSQAIKNIK